MAYAMKQKENLGPRVAAWIDTLLFRKHKRTGGTGQAMWQYGPHAWGVTVAGLGTGQRAALSYT